MGGNRQQSYVTVPVGTGIVTASGVGCRGSARAMVAYSGSGRQRGGWRLLLGNDRCRSGATLTAEVGAERRGLVLQTLVQPRRCLSRRIYARFWSSTCNGFVASGGEGGMGESSVVDTGYAYNLGRRGWQTTSCTFNSFAINRHRPSRAVVA